MHFIPRTLIALTLALAVAPSSAQPRYEPSEALTILAGKAVADAKAKFPNEKLNDDQIAVTVIDLTDPAKPRTGSFRGDAGFYPASVVKLFYLVATHRFVQDGKVPDSAELQRGLKDMIVDSSNEATQYIVDAITDAPNGADLPPEQMKAWAEKRNVVNRYFAGLGYTGINVCQKAYGEGPYGRERIFLGEKYENRNKLTTDATARLLAEIVQRRAVSAERSDLMMSLLQRDMAKARPGGGEDQARDFSAIALDKEKDKLWSKAGWTSTARHDAAYIERPDGTKVVVVTFTLNHARQKGIIPEVVRSVLGGMPNAQARMLNQ